MAMSSVTKTHSLSSAVILLQVKEAQGSPESKRHRSRHGWASQAFMWRFHDPRMPDHSKVLTSLITSSSTLIVFAHGSSRTPPLASFE